MFSISTQHIYPEFTSSFASTKATPAQLIYCLLNQMAGAICNSTVFPELTGKKGEELKEEEPNTHCS